MSIQNPHDRFFRDSFGRPEIARNYLEEYLPTDLRHLLDLDSLILQDGSFIDETMQEHQTDLLYQTQLNNGDTAYIYFLFEHKSYPDPMVALQLLRYMVRFWERQVKEGDPMEAIIPLVVYHGEKVWKISTDFLDLLDAPAELRPYLPTFHYHLNDFSHLSDETIRGEIWLRVGLETMRGILNPHLKAELGDLVTLMFQLSKQQTGLEYIRTILYYLSKATGRVSWQDLHTVLLQQGEQGESEMYTIADELMERGFEKGVKQGIEQGVEQGIEQGIERGIEQVARRLLEQHSVVTVSEYTGLTIEQVAALKDDDEHK